LKKSTTLSKTSTPSLNLKDQNSKPDTKLEGEKNVTRDNNFDTKSVENNEIKHNKPNSINKEQNYENINSYLESLPDLSFMLK
jgi:hypothetical protein